MVYLMVCLFVCLSMKLVGALVRGLLCICLFVCSFVRVLECLFVRSFVSSLVCFLVGVQPFVFAVYSDSVLECGGSVPVAGVVRRLPCNGHRDTKPTASQDPNFTTLFKASQKPAVGQFRFH